MPGRGETEAPQRRAITYCVIPRELAAKLHEPLRRHFAAVSAVEVIIEGRGRDRRAASGGRRAEEAGAGTAADDDRRLIRNLEGRRIADRRAPLIPAALPELPRRLARFADRLVFVQRAEPASAQAEDSDTARLVTRFQAGERDLFAEIYLRYFDRVYSYLLVVLRDSHEAEDATQQVFVNVLEALPRYERRSVPFRAWLFTIVRNYGIRQLRLQGRLDVVDPAELPDRPGADHETELATLQWVSDRELVLFIERLPLAQRQVLVLRFMLGLSTQEIAAVLERSTDNVRALQSRALLFLRQRLIALGREPAEPFGRARMRGRRDQRLVLRSRRFALMQR